MMQTKMSPDKQMRWINFLSQFHFHIAHILGKHNLVANALLRRPRVNVVSITYHNDLTNMVDAYAICYDAVRTAMVSAIATAMKEKVRASHHPTVEDKNEDCPSFSQANITCGLPSTLARPPMAPHGRPLP